MNNEILKIEEFVWSKIEEENRIGFLNGLSGIALFYKYLSDYNKDYYSKLTHIVDRINDLISKEAILPSICSGLAGYGFLLTQLKDSILIDESYFSDIDEILLDFLQSQSNNLDYDFLHGSLGISQYFIERYKTSNTKELESIVSLFYNNLFKRLNHNLEEVLLQKESDGSRSIYFGLAHGVAGILNSIYLYIKNFNVEVNTIDESILILLKFLDIYKLDNEDFKYPNYFSVDNNHIIRSRLAWCQGDLGIGNSLMNIGSLTYNKKLFIRGQELINRSLKVNLSQSGINDMGICHGTSGILLIDWLSLNKSNSHHKKDLSFWEEILKKQTKNYSEFKAFHKGKYIDEINILEGATGVALTKLTIENKINKNWISCLNLA